LKDGLDPGKLQTTVAQRLAMAAVAVMICLHTATALLQVSPALAADLQLRRADPSSRKPRALKEGGSAASRGPRFPSSLLAKEDPARLDANEGTATLAAQEDKAEIDAIGGASEDPDTGEDDATETETNDRSAKKKETKTKTVDRSKMSSREKWMSLWYWKPFICSVGFMMVMVDVFGPFYNRFVSFSLQSEVVLLIVTMFGFAGIVFYTMDPASAGVTILLAYASIGCTLSLLIGIMTLGVTLRGAKKEDPVMELFTDIAKLFRFVLRIVQVVIILNVITTEAAVDWGQLAMLMGFMMLGIALSLSGVIGDIMAHIFIRLDEHFHEGDYIIFEDDLVQIDSFGWRHTVGIKDSNAAFIYIPNSMLTSASLVNQSQDVDRQVEVDIPVDIDSESTEQALKNCWAVFERTKDPEFTFTGPDGQVYKNQFNTDECDVWLNAECDSIHITFVGLYFFSNPEPLAEGEEADEGEDRQMSWENGWFFQIQWFHLECKKLNEAFGAWPFLDSWGPTWTRSAPE